MTLTPARVRAVTSWLPFASVAFLLLGAGIRIYHWAMGRSLWLDEAYLAANVQSRDLVGILHPLEYNQSAPSLFLAGTDILTSVLSYDERVLRLLPLVASLLTLVLVWKLGKLSLNQWVLPLVVATVSFAYPFVYYAQELKHYALEVMVVVLVLYLVARLQASPAEAPARFRHLWWAGALGLFAAHTAPFVLAGAGLTALLGKLRRDLPLSWTALTVGGMGWGALFCVNYWFFIRPNYLNPFMLQFWAFAHPGAPWTVSGLRDWVFLSNEYLAYVGYSGGFKVLFGGAVFFGVLQAWRTRSLVMVAAVIGLGSYGFAVLMGKAPFAGRLALFLFPMALLLAAHGLGCSTGRWSLRALRIGAGLLLLYPAAAQLKRSLLQPIVVQNQREAIAYLVAHRQPDEPVHVVFQAQPALRFYRSRVEDVQANYVFGSETRVWALGPGHHPKIRPDLEILLQELHQLAARPVFWVLTGHMYEVEAEMLKAIESTFGYVPTERYQDHGAGAFKFEPLPPPRQELREMGD
jgi:hypothetical protein